jgi:hypothetical protein
MYNDAETEVGIRWSLRMGLKALHIPYYGRITPKYALPAVIYLPLFCPLDAEGYAILSRASDLGIMEVHEL